jgi:L-threonylcarbamoyladenylate synthase
MDKDTQEAVKVLNNKGVVVVPTDTVCGVLTLMDNEEGIKRIYKMKKRNPDKPLAILIPSVEWVWKWVEKTSRLAELCENYWPGAATIIMKTRDDKTIGLRMPDYKPLLEILNITGPVCATSANISGQKSPALISDISVEIKQASDLVIDFPLRSSGNPSKIIDARNEELKIVRN